MINQYAFYIQQIKLRTKHCKQTIQDQTSGVSRTHKTVCKYYSGGPRYKVFSRASSKLQYLLIVVL